MPAPLRITAVGEPLPIALDPDEIPDEIRRGLKYKDGHWCSDYPGVLSSQGRLVLILPRVYAGATGEALNGDPFVFLGALCRMLREARRSVADTEMWLEQALLASNNAWQMLDRLEAALLLLRDYAEHGPICIHERHASRRARGAIHWPRTLSRSLAIVSGPSVTISDPIQVRLRVDPRHPLTLLHEAVCADVHTLLSHRSGWSPSGLPAVHEEAQRRDALVLLERYERALFRDRHRIVAGLLRRYLGAAGLGDAREAQQVSGVLAVDFPMVWERMLAVVLGPARIPQMPTGAYRGAALVGAGAPLGRGLLLKPDLVIDGSFQDEEVIVVLDAKDYAPALTGRWPATESIGKQLLYRYLLSDRYKPGQLAFEKIGNAFLMPARMPTGPNSSGHHVCCAVHDIVGEQGPVPFGRIVCLDVDFERVARAYVHGHRDAELRSAIVATVMQAMHA